MKLRGSRPPVDHDIVVVGFDDKLRAKHPDVLQQRAGWAKFIRRLQTYEPKVVALDALFGAPELPLPPDIVAAVRSSHRELQAMNSRGNAEDSAFQRARAAIEQVDEATRGDERLANALSAGNNVFLPSLFFLEGGEDQPLSQTAPEPLGLSGAELDEGVGTGGVAALRPLRAEASVSVPLALLATATALGGHLNVVRDRDGKVRRVPAVVEQGGRFYGALGLMVARFARDAEVRYVAGARQIQFGDASVPSDPRGIVQINPLGRRGVFDTISAADVMDNTVATERLRGKIVFVGYTDVARDRVATSLDDTVPGVEIHATLAHNILYGEVLRPAPPKITLLLIVALGLLLSLLKLRGLRRRFPWLATVAAVVGIAFVVMGAELALEQFWLIEVAAPIASVVVIAVGSLTATLATEGREKARLRRAFGQYVAPSLVEKIADDPTQIRLGGVRRELTVLFSDIRGFSSFSEGMDPEALSGFLNEYLTPMSDIVMEQGGMLDKFIGDAVMAVYGAPLAQPDHAVGGCSSALDMIAQLEGLNAGWTARGLPAIRIGVGLNSGDMSVGNMGSLHRFDYTVIGDRVNLAARLEALTKEYRTAILCGPRTKELAEADFVFRELDFVRVKGRGGTVKIYDLLGRRGECPYTESWLDAYQQALGMYRQKEWRQAADAFAALRSELPDDGPVAVMIERVAQMQHKPPKGEWDGVYEQRSK